MKSYVCEICGYVYDEKVGDVDNGVAAGTPFAEIDDAWLCPPCGVGKEHFSEM